MMTFDDFKAELAERCPVHRAQAIVGAIGALPVGTRVAGYVREPGKDRWRCEYSSLKRRRDGSTRVELHASYTTGWALALDVAFAPQHRAKEIENISKAAYGVMIAQGLSRLPEIGRPDPVKAMPIFVELPPPPPPPPAPAPKLGQQFALPL